MTKSKKGVFLGAWLDPTIPTDVLVQRIRNEPGRIGSDIEGPIIQAVIYQHALWEFEKKWVATEPEARVWAALILKIKMTESPEWRELYKLRAQIDQLPRFILGQFDWYVFQQRETGWRPVIDCAIDQAIDDANKGQPSINTHVDILRTMLAYFSQMTYKSRRGPKLSCEGALSAVTKAILSVSDLDKPQARALAADLLDLSGVRVPLTKSQQVERTKNI